MANVGSGTLGQLASVITASASFTAHNAEAVGIASSISATTSVGATAAAQINASPCTLAASAALGACRGGSRYRELPAMTAQGVLGASAGLSVIGSGALIASASSSASGENEPTGGTAFTGYASLSATG